MTDSPSAATSDPTPADAPRDAPSDGTADDTAGVPWWRRIDRSVAAVTAIVAIGFVVVLNGVLSGVTGEERVDLPPTIESLAPVPDAVQVLSQSNVFVDLAPDHIGVLVIDGIELETVSVDELGSLAIEPGQQVDLPPVTIYEPGNATLTFTPNEGAPIEEWTEGEHRVQVVYWRIDEGRQRARSYTWTFSVV